MAGNEIASAGGEAGDVMKREEIACGRRVSCQPVTFGDGKRYTGRVIYAHAGGRWITVEFETPGGPLRESFMREDVELIC